MQEFDEIRPYEAEEMKQAFEDLLNDRQFQLILKGFVPWLPKSLRNGFLKLAFTGIKTPLDFQLRWELILRRWGVIHSSLTIVTLYSTLPSSM